MTKDQLKTGMVVELRNGERYLVLTGDLPTTFYEVKSTIFVNSENFEVIDFYSEDLIRTRGSSEYDIMKVFKPNIINLKDMISSIIEPPIWQREPEVDWSKIPVDTKVYVRDREEDQWTSRYFARYEHGKVHAWEWGATSFSVDDDSTCPWNFAKLA